MTKQFETSKTKYTRRRKKQDNICLGCGQYFGDSQLFSYEDPYKNKGEHPGFYCWRCYNEKYPDDQIGVDMILKTLGYKIKIDRSGKHISIALPLEAASDNWKTYELTDTEQIIKDYEL